MHFIPEQKCGITTQTHCEAGTRDYIAPTSVKVFIDHTPIICIRGLARETSTGPGGLAKAAKAED